MITKEMVESTDALRAVSLILLFHSLELRSNLPGQEYAMCSIYHPRPLPPRPLGLVEFEEDAASLEKKDERVSAPFSFKVLHGAHARNSQSLYLELLLCHY